VTGRGSRSVSLRSVFGRTFREEGHALVGWVVGLVLYGATMLAMYPTVRGNKDFAKLLDSYPKALKTLFAITDYTSGPGYLRAEVFSLLGPLLLIIFAVLWGGDLTAGEEERGTIDLLLANPISRRRVVIEKWLAMVAGVAVATTSLGLTLGLGAPLVHLSVTWAELGAAVVATVLLAILFGTVALAVGAGTGRRGVARGSAAALAVTAYLLSSLSELVTWLRHARPASPWYHAIGVDPLRNGFLVAHLAVLVAVALVFLVAAVVLFERRDLAT